MARRLVLVLLLAALVSGCAVEEAPPSPTPSPTVEATPSTEHEGHVSATATGTSASVSASMAPSSSATSSSSTAPAKVASRLVLVAVDLGAGWSSDPVEDAPGSAPNSTDDATAYAYKTSGSGTPYGVQSTARVFVTAAAAHAYFESARADLAGAPLTDVDAGDDAFLWVQSAGRWEEGWVLERTVVWELLVTGDGGSPSPTTPTLMRKAADKA